MPRERQGSLTPFGRRVRAALVLGGRTAADVSPELNISPRTFERMLYGKREARDWEIRRIAELTGVPEWFLREGFEGAAPRPAALREDVADLNATVDEIFRQIARLADQGQARTGEREPGTGERRESGPPAGA